jgi:hypothetical protein
VGGGDAELVLELRLPLERVDLGDVAAVEALDNVTAVGVHGDAHHHARAVSLGEGGLREADEVRELVDLLVHVLGHGVGLVGLEVLEHLLDLLHVVDREHDQSRLGGVQGLAGVLVLAQDPLGARDLGVPGLGG